MWYGAHVAELKGGMRAKIHHEALAVERHLNNHRSVVFGKAASHSYVNQDRKAIKTAWVAKFEEFWMANTFSFMLNRLLERNGWLSYFEDGSNEDTLGAFYANGEKVYETEDNNANNDEDSDNDYHHKGGGDEIEDKSSQEEE
jgi:hypothetical protein